MLDLTEIDKRLQETAEKLAQDMKNHMPPPTKAAWQIAIGEEMPVLDGEPLMAIQAFKKGDIGSDPIKSSAISYAETLAIDVGNSWRTPDGFMERINALCDTIHARDAYLNDMAAVEKRFSCALRQLKAAA